MLLARNSLSEKVRLKGSLAAGRILSRLDAYRKARTVMFYATHGSEMQTEKMIENSLKKGKRVVLPVTNMKKCTLKACIADSLETLEPGAYGIREPQKEGRISVRPSSIDLILVPGTAFDKTGRRLGYGKGYYDRWLKRIPVKNRVGLAFTFQVVDRLPHQRHDEHVGTIVTEKTVYSCRTAELHATDNERSL